MSSESPTPDDATPAGSTQPEPDRPIELEHAGGDAARRDSWSVIAVALAVFALAASVVGVGFGLRAIDESDGTTGAAPATGESMTVAVELTEMRVEPARLEVPAGTDLTLEVRNAGTMPHDLAFSNGTGTAMLDPGEDETLHVGVIDESLAGRCTVPGHAEAGMTMEVVVEGDQAPVTGGDDHTGGGDDAAVIDFDAEPAPEWQPFDPELEPAPGGTHHEITLRATETEVEIAPGVTQKVWTFNDQVPGPILRGKVGDLFTITLVNEGEIGHSIDFHASKVAWNDEMRTIGPGESLVYQFEAKHAGIFMYHCGTAPTLHHIGNGMHGAVVIDPPDLPEVDREFVFVQSEFYTGPQGEPGSFTKMVNDEWDAVVFNGYVNQYLHAPIRVDSGERVRAWVVNNGPSENSSFHIVGTIFDTVYKEGAYRLRPDDTHGGAQALDLQPAQGGFVEFTFDEDGLYPIVTHKFSNVGKGALGLFQSGDGESGDVGGH